MTGGGDINSLGLLPDKLKTEIALHVNLETLKKVRTESIALLLSDKTSMHDVSEVVPNYFQT